jgi:hypothetical protein
MPPIPDVRVCDAEWSFMIAVARDHHVMLKACPLRARSKMLRRLVRREDISESVTYPLPLVVFRRVLAHVGYDQCST